MADDLYHSSRSDNKRKFDDHGGATAPSVSPPASFPRTTGFSTPITSPPSVAATTPSYNSVPPPLDGIELAKRRAQEIAARIFSDAEAKRPRVDSGGTVDDSSNKSFGHDHQTLKSMGQSIGSQFGATTSALSSVGFAGSSKRIYVPNGRVGVIIGKSGETIKYLQMQSGARIQVTRDMDADPHSQSRPVELIGTPEQISKAEQLISDVISEADAGGSSTANSRNLTDVPAGSEHFSMKVPNNKVGLIIGKGGEAIRNMQATSGARIQVIPLHPPPGDTSSERTVHIDGTKEQIEAAKLLVNDVISENRGRNPTSTGGYRPPRPPTSWVPTGAPPMNQPGYGYMQAGAYPPPPPSQYMMSQLPYNAYPTASSGWDQSTNTSTQQTSPATGYDYYAQLQQQQQQQSVVVSSTPDGNTYNYSQMPSAYNGEGSYTTEQSSAQAGGYPQPVYNLQAGYTQHGYGPAAGYGNAAASNQDGSSQQGFVAEQPATVTQADYVQSPAQKPPQALAYAQGYGQASEGYPQPSTATAGYGVPGYGQQQFYGGGTQSQATEYGQPAGDSYYGGSNSQNMYSSGTYDSTAAPTNGVVKPAPKS